MRGKDSNPKLNARSVTGRLKSFYEDEYGGLIIFGLVLLTVMILITGMAIDFMRHEYARVRLQSTIDRSVLAAADLDQTRGPKAVVQDYFDKSGLAELGATVVIEEPDVSTIGEGDDEKIVRRAVKATGVITMQPIVLDEMGIELLNAAATGTAAQGVNSREISMVIDISGSMRFDKNGGRNPAEKDRRITKLRLAVEGFTGVMLDPNVGAQDVTAIHVVPYAGNVNPGPHMYYLLGGERPKQTYSHCLEFDDGGKLAKNGGGNAPDLDFDRMGPPNGTLPQILPVSPQIATQASTPIISWDEQIAFEDGGHVFNGGTDLGTRAQLPHFHNWPIETVTMDWGWCPQDASAILYAQNDKTTIDTYVNNIRLHDGTATHLGAKWGVMLLDPSMRPIFAKMAARTAVTGFPASAAARGFPLPWLSDAERAQEEKRKIMVLMTDGQTNNQARPENTGVIGGKDWDQVNLDHELDDKKNGRFDRTTTDTNLDNLKKICDLAKEDGGLTIYTITMDVKLSGKGKTNLEGCAGNGGKHFDATSDNIVNTFKAIARDITKLRLTQ